MACEPRGLLTYEGKVRGDVFEGRFVLRRVLFRLTADDPKSALPADPAVDARARRPPCGCPARPTRRSPGVRDGRPQKGVTLRARRRAGPSASDGQGTLAELGSYEALVSSELIAVERTHSEDVRFVGGISTS